MISNALSVHYYIFFCPSPKKPHVPPVKPYPYWVFERMIELSRQERIANTNMRKYTAIRGSEGTIATGSKDAIGELKQWRNYNDFKGLYKIAEEKRVIKFTNYKNWLKMQNKQLYKLSKSPSNIKSIIKEKKYELSFYEAELKRLETVSNKAAVQTKATAQKNMLKYSKELYKTEYDIKMLEGVYKDIAPLSEAEQKFYLQGVQYKVPLTSINDVADELVYLRKEYNSITKKLEGFDQKTITVTRNFPNADNLVLYKGKVKELNNKLKAYRKACPTDVKCSIGDINSQINLNKKIIKAIDDDLAGGTPIHKTRYYKFIDDDAFKDVNRRYLNYKDFMETQDLTDLYKTLQSIKLEKEELTKAFGIISQFWDLFKWV